jgi:hypothetical protein
VERCSRYVWVVTIVSQTYFRWCPLRSLKPDILRRLKKLDISANPLTTIESRSSATPSAFPRLEELVLKETTVDDWHSLTNLSTWFSGSSGGLESLKISIIRDVSISLQDGDRTRLSGTRADRAGLVARFPSLEELNSLPVSYISISVRVSL